MRFAASSSTATPVNISSPAAGAVQRTDPTKSDASVPVNIYSMYRASCPLASRGIATSSSTVPFFINRQVTTSSDSLRFRIAAAVLRFPALLLKPSV